MSDRRSRRRFVQELGVVAAVAGLAGCSGGDGGDGESDDGGDGSDGGDGGSSESTPMETPSPTATPADTPAETATAASTPMETPTPTATPGGSGGGGEIADYLADVGNYDGSVIDATGQSEVTVEVGAEGNGSGFAYGPPAIRIDSGTTVRWDWIGQGGLHNVVAENGAFDSGEPVSGDQPTFEHTFEETGIYRYFCSPHKALGMKGAVEVV
jgi:halocyanin-like protein